jgi:2-phosphosulfolactate phosphatase
LISAGEQLNESNIRNTPNKKYYYFHSKENGMKVEVLEFVEGARKARGIAVIIDVFRAFSVACYAYDAGVSSIIATDEVEEAFRLKERNRNSLIAGERDEKKVDGFDFGNSPTEILQNDLSGRILIHTTTAGTQGIVNAVNADIVISGSFVNAGAIVRYIKKIDPEYVSLVAMGYRALISAEEDLLCAEYITDGLLGRKTVTDELVAGLMQTSGNRFFLKANREFSPPSDFFLCTMKDRFDFILKASKRDDGNVLLIKEMV